MKHFGPALEIEVAVEFEVELEFVERVVVVVEVTEAEICTVTLSL